MNQVSLADYKLLVKRLLITYFKWTAPEYDGDASITGSVIEKRKKWRHKVCVSKKEDNAGFEVPDMTKLPQPTIRQGTARTSVPTYVSETCKSWYRLCSLNGGALGSLFQVFRVLFLAWTYFTQLVFVSNVIFQVMRSFDRWILLSNEDTLQTADCEKIWLKKKKNYN